MKAVSVRKTCEGWGGVQSHELHHYYKSVRETSSLTLGEEHRLMVLDIRELRKTLEHSRTEVAGELRGLHIEELYDLYS